MASENVIGGKWTLDTTDLKAGIAEANRLIRISETEFKAAAAGMGDWTKSADGLSAKAKSLNSVIDIQEQKVNALKEQYAQVADEKGKNSKAAQDLQVKINRETATLNKNKYELDNVSKSLEDMQKPMDEAGDETDKFSKKVKEAGDNSLKTGDIIKANLISDAIIGGVKALGSAFVGLAKSVFQSVESTREYRKDLSKLEQNTKDAGMEFDFVKGKLSELTAITGETDSSIEALSNLMASGIDQNQMTDAIDALSGAVIRFPDTLKIESLSDSLQETVKGGKATGQFAELIERSGANLDNFNAKLSTATTEADRQRVALEFLASSGLAEVNEEYRNSNEAMLTAEESQFKLNDAIATFSAKLEPTVSLLKGGFANILTELVGVMTGTTDSTDGLTTAINDLAKDLVSLIENAIPIVTDVFETIVPTLIQAIVDALPTLIPAVTNIIMTLVNLLIDNLPELIKAGIELIVALAQGLIKAIPDLIKAIPEIVEAIFEAFGDVDWLEIGVSIVEGIWEGIKSLAGWFGRKVDEWFDDAVSGIADFLGINSPSTLFRDEIGKNMAAGIGVGFMDGMKKVNKDIQSAIPTSIGTDINIGSVGATGAVATGSNVNFTQNIYSPKALTPYEVYRQTKNASQLMNLGVA